MTINHIAAAKTIDSYYCSSDEQKILDAAQEEGYTPVVRPSELAAPTSQHFDAIMHAISVIKEKEELADILVVILANNVTIKSQWIDKCVKMMQDGMTISAVVPVYKDNDHHPLRGKRVVNGRLEMYEQSVKGKISTNR